jgi:hypothetical protein
MRPYEKRRIWVSFVQIERDEKGRIGRGAWQCARNTTLVSTAPSPIAFRLKIPVFDRESCQT